MQQIVYLDTKKNGGHPHSSPTSHDSKKSTIQPNANKKIRRKTFHHKDLYKLYNNPKTANDEPKGGKRQRKKRHLGKRKTPFHKMARRRASQTAKERDEERHTEINEEAMEYGQHYILTSGNKRDDGQSGVHRGGPASGDWGKTAEPAGEQRGAKQGDEFARDVGKQGHRAKLGAAVFGYENARKRIIAKARAYGEAAGQAMVGEQEARQRHTGKRAEDGDKRQQQQTGTDATYAFQHTGITAHTDTDKEHKGAKGIKADVTDVADKRRHDIEHADKRADNEEPDNDKTAFHLLDKNKNNGKQHA